MTSEAERLLEAFAQQHAAKFNGAGAPSTPRDLVIMRGLVKEYGAQLIRSRIPQFFQTSADRFLGDQGYTVQMLAFMLGRWAAAARRAASDEREAMAS